MSDFFQHGLISTLHRLVDGPLIGRHESLPALESVVLVLPCHYAEIGTAALYGIVESLNKATFLSLIVVSMNGIPDLLTREVQLFWSKLQKSHVVLGNDSPNLLEQLARQGLPFNPGKGLNLWLAFGWLAANQSSGTVLVHDCDISNYNLDLPLTLALPVAGWATASAKDTTAESSKSCSAVSPGFSSFHWFDPWFGCWGTCLCSTLSTAFVIPSLANIR